MIFLKMLIHLNLKSDLRPKLFFRLMDQMDEVDNVMTKSISSIQSIKSIWSIFFLTILQILSLIYSMTRTHFAPFFHNNALVFQFIIKEFLFASKEMQVAVQLSEQIKSKGNLLNTKQQPFCIELSFSLSKLVGSKHESSDQLPWNLHRGILTKLREYTDLFAQTLNEDHVGYNLHDHFHKALLKCKQALDLLTTKHQRFDNPIDISRICLNIEQARREIWHGARLIAQTIIRFRENENVIFFLLRHSERIIDLYGAGFLKRLLCKMHPPSLSCTQAYIKQRFTSRGFDNLIPIVQQKLLILE